MNYATCIPLLVRCRVTAAAQCVGPFSRSSGNSVGGNCSEEFLKEETAVAPPPHLGEEAGTPAATLGDV